MSDFGPEGGGETPSPDEIRQVLYAAEDARNKAANQSVMHPPTAEQRSLADRFLDEYQMPEYAEKRHAAERAAKAATQGPPTLLAAPPPDAPSPAAPPKAVSAPAEAEDNLGVVPMSPPPAQAPPAAPPQAIPSAPVAPARRQSPADVALADPNFAAYLALRAKEMKAAQGQANGNQRMADLANAGVKVSAAFEGKDPDVGRMAANNARAQMPVTQLQQRNADTAQAGKDYGEQQEIGAKTQAQNLLLDSQKPGTPISQRGYMLAVAQGLIPPSFPASQYTESMRQDMLKGATIQQARQQHQATIAESMARLNEETRHHKVEESYMGQKELPPNVEKEVGSLISGSNGLSELDAARGNAGFLGSIADKMGFGDYHAVKAGVSAEVAKADSRGNANPAAAARLESQLPGGLTPGGGLNIATKQKAMLDQAEQRVKALEAGRFNPAQVKTLRDDLEAAKARVAGYGGGSPAPAAKPVTRTDPATGETRTWNGRAWVK